MSVIKVNCIDQALAFENTPVIASGGLEDYVSFTFCERWEDYTRTAVFWRNEADAYHVVMGRENICQLPPEVTGDEGIVYFGVFGVDGDGKQRTSNVLTYRIEKGAITVASAPSDPTPDIYTQLLAMERAFETHIEQLVVNRMVPDNTLTTNKLKDGIVTTEKIAEGAVTAPELADGSVITPKLGDRAVTTEKLADGAVKTPNIAGGAVTYSNLSYAAVQTILNKGTQVAVGSYVGTGGSVTEENPMRLTFDFAPKLVFVQRADNPSFWDSFTAIYGCSSAVKHPTGDSITGEGLVSLEWSENTLTWWMNGQIAYQMNDSGVTYNYVAIGVGA